MKSVIVKDKKSKIICFFSDVKEVSFIVNDLYTKVTLEDGKYFIFDNDKYSVELLTGKKVRIVNEL